MKDKKFSYPPVQIGASFLLLIFVVLCMITFSVLSLSSAINDYNYSQKNANRVAEYYAANNIAEEKLSEIDLLLKNNAISGKNIEYLVPINDAESLKVVLELHPENIRRYTIVSWKQVYTKEWVGHQNLPVLSGQ